jgi:hypothetical protein
MDKNNDSLLVPIAPNFNVDWTPEHETILVEWADKAMCYRWLHARSNVMYNKLNTWYTIPVIIISTLTGTANFAQTRVPLAYQSLYVMIVGGFNILAGIITTIQQFLKVTQLNEAHRVASIAWDKFYRNIKIELAKHPDERMPVTQMIKISKEEFDRLMETSPNIPAEIITMFKYEFKDEIYMDPKAKIIKPEICDVLISTELSRNQWFSEDNKNKRISQMINKEKLHLDMISNFKQTFINLNNREPLDSEIIDNLKDKDKVDIILLLKTIEQLNKNTNANNNAKIATKINDELV